MATYTQTQTFNPSVVVIGDISYVNFKTEGSGGLWKYNGTTWTQISNYYCDQMIAFGDKLVAVFPRTNPAESGTWTYTNPGTNPGGHDPSGWERCSEACASYLWTANDALYADFINVTQPGAEGVYKGDGTYLGWNRILGSNFTTKFLQHNSDNQYVLDLGTGLTASGSDWVNCLKLIGTTNISNPGALWLGVDTYSPYQHGIIIADHDLRLRSSTGTIRLEGSQYIQLGIWSYTSPKIQFWGWYNSAHTGAEFRIEDANTVTFRGATIENAVSKFDIYLNTTINGTLAVSGNISATSAAISTVTATAVNCTSLSADNVTMDAPTFVTPTLGAALATSINNVKITAVASTATLSIASGKIFCANNSISVAGGDGSVFNFGNNNITLTTSGTTALTLPTSGTVTALGNDYTGANGIVRATSPSITTPTLTNPTISGTIYANDCLIRRTTPTVNASTSGTTTSYVTGEALSFANVVYLKSDSKVYKANNTSAGTYPCIAMALNDYSIGATGNFLLDGLICNTGWSWTVGGIIYLSSSGVLTQTSPSATDYAVQVVGVATSATSMIFRPSFNYFTHT